MGIVQCDQNCLWLQDVTGSLGMCPISITGKHDILIAFYFRCYCCCSCCWHWELLSSLSTGWQRALPTSSVFASFFPIRTPAPGLDHHPLSLHCSFSEFQIPLKMKERSKQVRTPYLKHYMVNALCGGSAPNLCDFRRVAGSYTVYPPGYERDESAHIKHWQVSTEVNAIPTLKGWYRKWYVKGNNANGKAARATYPPSMMKYRSLSLLSREGVA